MLNSDSGRVAITQRVNNEMVNSPFVIQELRYEFVGDEVYECWSQR